MEYRRGRISQEYRRWGRPLVDAPWDASIAAPGDDPTLRETTFGGGRGLLSFRVDDDAEMIHVFAITWIG
jgi:hypothetical protein